MRWKDKYKVGDVVETQVFFADGSRWGRARVLRKTRTGQLIVQLTQNPAVIFSVTRAQDIRSPS